MKREEIFIMENPDYRVVCRFGYDEWIDFAWWGHIQRKVKYKKWLLFGEIKERWTEIHQCWWSKEMTSIEDLKSSAERFYDEKVCLKKRIAKQAMELS